MHFKTEPFRFNLLTAFFSGKSIIYQSKRNEEKEMKMSLQAIRNMDRNIWIRFIGESINGIAMMMLMPFFALYMSDKVDHFWQVGVVMAMGPIAGVLGSLIGGKLADQYGRKPIMIVSMVGNGLVMLGFIFSMVSILSY
jgi:predicted MFS family arabinose efflux permease